MSKASDRKRTQKVSQKANPVGVRFETSEKAEIALAAQIVNLTATDIIRIGAINAARYTIRNRQMPPSEQPLTE